MAKYGRSQQQHNIKRRLSLPPGVRIDKDEITWSYAEIIGIISICFAVGMKAYLKYSISVPDLFCRYLG